jgi:peptidylprolyl isomerase
MSSSDSEEERNKKKSEDKEHKKKKKKKRSRDTSSDSDSKKKKKRSRDTDSDSDSGKKKKKPSSSESDSSDSSSKKKKKDKKSKKHKKNKTHKKDKKKSKKSKKDRDKREAVVRAPEPVKIPEREKVGLVEEVASSRFGMTEKKILRVGTGRRPERGQTVTVSGTGYIEAGMRPFWSTSDKYAKNYSFTAGIGRVVAGWDAGVMAMRIGEKARLTMTGSFGYGMQGNAELKIPSMANLVIDLELLAIGEEVNLPTPDEIAKQKIASKPVFVEREKDPELARQLSFNAAPF